MNALFATRWWSWPRFACLVFTIIVVAVLFQRIDLTMLGSSLARLHPGWWLVAFASYGLALLCGGIRWHLALHSIRCAVHAGASLRFCLIGHFFFLVLFGAVAGDIAKSALYARWYRFGMPEVAASAPIDRTLGILAAFLVSALAVVVGWIAGGFLRMDSSSLPIPSWAYVVTGLLLVLTFCLLVFWKPAGESWWARVWRTLCLGAREFRAAPKRLAWAGLAAVAAQVAMSAVLALNLRGLSDESLSWVQLAWTFPAIMMFSSLPITAAGAGVRELLALTFLGLYDVPAGDCVAAATLTLSCKVAWALIGGGVLWTESILQQKSAATPDPKSISVVIPALNESDALPATVEHIRQNSFIHEIIVVDGGSTDRTPEIAEQLGCRVLSHKPGRGDQMRAGAEAATGDVILLLHADTWLSPHGTRALLACLRDRTVVAGGFWKEFRESPLLLLGSKWKCAVRLWVGRRIAGDQTLFIRREALDQIGGVPEMALMEEFEMCRRLRRLGRLALADAVVVTSARRFLKLGIFRTYLRMWHVATQYRLGTAPAELRELYEKD